MEAHIVAHNSTRPKLLRCFFVTFFGSTLPTISSWSEWSVLIAEVRRPAAIPSSTSPPTGEIFVSRFLLLFFLFQNGSVFAVLGCSVCRLLVSWMCLIIDEISSFKPRIRTCLLLLGVLVSILWSLQVLFLVCGGRTQL